MTGTQLTIEQLIQRATGGCKFDRHKLFYPSLAYYLLKDPFWLWCEQHAPREEAVDETTRYDELRMAQGREYERQWVWANFPEAIEVAPTFGFEALKNTFRAMLGGAVAIYQPQLWDLAQDTYGKGDILIRDNSAPSDLGDFHYRVIEIKRSLSLRDSHVLQAAFYNQSLGRLQGYVPPEMTVILKDSAKTISYQGEEKDIDAARLQWRRLQDGSVIPEARRPPHATSSPWRVYANKQVLECKDLLLIARLQKRDREKLRLAGIRSVDQLWNMRQEQIAEIIGEQAADSAYHVAQAYKRSSPILKPAQELRIPRAKRLLYFDFETSDFAYPNEQPHTYLMGCYDGTRDQFVKFLARGAEDEARIFTEFLDYVGDPRDVCLYHWTDFEIHQMRRVMRRWPSLSMLEQVIGHCLYLQEHVEAAVYLPVPSFSIKSVAPALGFHWRQKDIGAYQSMVCYWDYLENRDLFAIDPALIYNEDDCRAMWHVDQELTRRLSVSG